ncbi:hypothetical protein G4B88_013612 [Cannabis sativa]|uniref:Uncharacterized protein n=1 Tax=Cannabis sativa TaxID=3483 RepID=A0A7J6HT95_CANSA|nr:hypothetical protein G4B88_013612 [Cannabis sativa]
MYFDSTLLCHRFIRSASLLGSESLNFQLLSPEKSEPFAQIKSTEYKVQARKAEIEICGYLY